MGHSDPAEVPELVQQGAVSCVVPRIWFEVRTKGANNLVLDERYIGREAGRVLRSHLGGGGERQALEGNTEAEQVEATVFCQGYSAPQCLEG